MSAPVLALDAEVTHKRLASVERLLNQSSAAKQILAADNQEALALRAEALDLYRQAVTADKKGDTEQVALWLDRASETFFSAVRLASKKEVDKAKAISDIGQRQESTLALLEAHERVSKEKGQIGEHRKIRQQVEEKLRSAAAHQRSGEILQADQDARAAYLYVKLSLGGMREGDTLVRTLSFASPKEEYVYELDRNDTHKMLVLLLVDEKNVSARVKTMTTPLLEEAKELREKAEHLAARGEYEGAIERLEQSTQQTLRAIRVTGVYIPN